ncbi:hypothetical protein GQ457_16G028310 [Hibiscus cannabinus]
MFNFENVGRMFLMLLEIVMELRKIMVRFLGFFPEIILHPTDYTAGISFSNILQQATCTVSFSDQFGSDSGHHFKRNYCGGCHCHCRQDKTKLPAVFHLAPSVESGLKMLKKWRSFI